MVERQAIDALVNTALLACGWLVRHYGQTPANPSDLGALTTAIRELRITMTTATEHLTAALEALKASVTEAAVEIANEAQALRDAHGNDDSAAVEAAATEIEARAQALHDAVSAAEAPPLPPLPPEA